MRGGRGGHRAAGGPAQVGLCACTAPGACGVQEARGAPRCAGATARTWWTGSCWPPCAVASSAWTAWSLCCRSSPGALRDACAIAVQQSVRLRGGSAQVCGTDRGRCRGPGHRGAPPTHLPKNLPTPGAAGADDSLARVQIAAKRWRIDLKAAQQAQLMLSAVNLPGGVQVGLIRPLLGAGTTSVPSSGAAPAQRRRNAEDELNMRAVYEEGDLIAAEVQQLHADGSIVLHTRSHKYGKVRRALCGRPTPLHSLPAAHATRAACSLRAASWWSCPPTWSSARNSTSMSMQTWVRRTRCWLHGSCGVKTAEWGSGRQACTSSSAATAACGSPTCPGRRRTSRSRCPGPAASSCRALRAWPTACAPWRPTTLRCPRASIRETCQVRSPPTPAGSCTAGAERHRAAAEPGHGHPGGPDAAPSLRRGSGQAGGAAQAGHLGSAVYRGLTCTARH